jgi:hypothetical protein
MKNTLLIDIIIFNKRGVMMGKNKFVLLFLLFVVVLSHSAVSGDMKDPSSEFSGYGTSDLEIDYGSYYGTSVVELGAGFSCIRTSNGKTTVGYPFFGTYTVMDAEEEYGFLENDFPEQYLIDDMFNYPQNDKYWSNNPVFQIDIPFDGTDGNLGLVSTDDDRKPFLYEGQCSLFVKAIHTVYEDDSGELDPSNIFDLVKIKNCESDSKEQLSSDECMNGEIYQSYNKQSTEGMQVLENELQDYYRVGEGGGVSDIPNDFDYFVNWDLGNDGCIGSHLVQDTIENGQSPFINYLSYSPEGKTIINAHDECCGDDYLWIMNGAYNDIDPAGQEKDDLCLYSYSSVKTDFTQVDYNINMFHPYRSFFCTPTYLISDVHTAYDDYLTDYQNNDKNRVLFQYNRGDSSSTTDVGVRYLDIDVNVEEDPNDIPLYCHHYYDNGENFDWIKSNEIGEIHYFKVNQNLDYTSDNIPLQPGSVFSLNKKAPDYIYDVVAKNANYYGSDKTKYDENGDGKLDSDELTICNLFLDGTWTGHHCCGNKYDYDNQIIINESFNDPYEDGMHYVYDRNEVHNYEMDVADAIKIPNKACYQGDAVNLGTILNTNLNEGIDKNNKLYINALGAFEPNKPVWCEFTGSGMNLEFIGNDILDIVPIDDAYQAAAEWCCLFYGDTYTLIEENEDNPSPHHYYCAESNVVNADSILMDGELQLCTDKTDSTYYGSLGYKYNYGDINPLSPLTESTDKLFVDENDPNVYDHCNTTTILQNEHIENLEDNDIFYFCNTNNTWLSVPLSDTDPNKGTSSNPTPFGMLGRLPNGDEQLFEVDKPIDFTGQSSGCCFKDDCWNGNKCINNGKTTTKDDIVYVCSYGDFETGEPTFNWYDERFAGELTESIGVEYCKDDWSCACPAQTKYSNIEGEDDGWTITECEKYSTQENGCTRFPWTYVGDRFCEVTDIVGDVDDPADYNTGNWTTRTKYLATALLKLADVKLSNDYTLHCDDAENVFNFYPEASQYWDEYIKDTLYLGGTEFDYDTMNNFCVLLLNPQSNDEEVFVGTTLNPLLDYEIEESLYSEVEDDGEQCTEEDGETDFCTSYMNGDPQTAPLYACYNEQCKLTCIDDGQCNEEYEGFGEHECIFLTQEDQDNGDGICVPQGPEFVDMLNIDEYFTQLLYGDGDDKALMNSPYLFNNPDALSENICTDAAEASNPKDLTDFLLFKTCNETYIAYNNLTKAVILSKDQPVPDDQPVPAITVSYSNVQSSILTTYATDFKDFLITHDQEIKDWGTNINIINSISDFDRIYYRVKDEDLATEKKIFGVLERKSYTAKQPDGSDYAHKLRYFYIIKYMGFDDLFYTYTEDNIDKCSIVNDPNAPFDYIGCFRDADDYYLVSPPQEEYYQDNGDPYISEFWFDLTSKLRLD